MGESQRKITAAAFEVLLFALPYTINQNPVNFTSKIRFDDIPYLFNSTYSFENPRLEATFNLPNWLKTAGFRPIHLTIRLKSTTVTRL